MIDNLPVQTAQIYDYLSKGNFLCSNTSVKELRTLFSVVEDNFERLRDYFSHINFVLEQGNNYFYFSRKEPRATLERKLPAFLRLDRYHGLLLYVRYGLRARFHFLAGGDIGTFPY